MASKWEHRLSDLIRSQKSRNDSFLANIITHRVSPSFLKVGLVCGFALTLSACVSSSVQPVLSVNENSSISQNNETLALFEENENGEFVSADGAAASAPNIPVQAPRGTDVATGSEVTSQVATASDGAERLVPVEGVSQDGQNLTTQAQAVASSSSGTNTPADTAGENQQPAAETQVAALVGNETTKAETATESAVSTNAETPATLTGQADVQTASLEPQAAAKKPNFFERLFGKPNSANKKAAARTNDQPRPRKTVARLRSETAATGNLPGVKSNRQLFGLDEVEGEEQTQNTQVASAAGFGRLSPADLRVQHSGVNVSCIKPGVIRILKVVERHYGKKPIITSGYRSAKANRRAGGARNSQHIYCKAVDIQVEGVSKWDLAKFLRTVPGRGGVGTYCRTKSVHVDIGSKRDWHHPCRRSAKRKKKRA